MPIQNDIKFIENPGLNGADNRYMTITLDTKRVLESWQLSLFSFEWLHPDGRIKALDELPDHEKPRRIAVENKLKNGISIEQPVLGIGIADNIEIGMGRTEFLTLAAHGMKQIPVHIPKSCESDFKPFLADVKS
jgi:hypothetical protein